VSQLPFHRVLKLRTTGYDVWGARRAVLRFLDDDKKWKRFQKLTDAEKKTYGVVLAADVGLAQDRLTAGAKRGQFDEETLRALEDAKAFDVIASGLWRMQYAKTPVAICYPYPTGEGGGVCQGLHPTAGLPGNWAIDFCDTPGARVLAVEAGTISRLSGHPPTEDTWDTQGVFGWNTYIRTRANYEYFITHLGWQNPKFSVGAKVSVGDVIGKVGDQKFRPDHCHYGVTSPFGEADAKKRITAVSLAPRIHL